jgi:dTDP-4-dehydrorhamnose reductase
MRICIFGPGFLGARLSQTLPDAILSRADVTDPKAIAQELARIQPDAVINAAGKTGTPNVDWCETNQIPTYQSNVVGALQLASVCAEKNIYLLHLASGCVFYGPSPMEDGWREEDIANPISFYSRTKYAADLILSRLPNVGIARLRMPIDSVPGPRNLITKLASYARVVDVENSVTVVSDLVLVVKQLVEKRAVGVFHVTNPGTMRHQRLLSLYRELVEPTHRYELISETELLSSGLVVKQRSNCILSSQNLQRLGISMRPIDEALQDTMRQYAKNKTESNK